MKSFATEKKKQLDNIAVSGTRRHSRAADIWLRLVRDKSAVVSLVLLGSLSCWPFLPMCCSINLR